VAKAGTFLGLISPTLALGMAALTLFGSSYSHQTGDSAGNSSPGSISAFRYALEQGDYAWFFWSGFVVGVCLIAAAGALWAGLQLSGRVRLLCWFCRGWEL